MIGQAILRLPDLHPKVFSEASVLASRPPETRYSKVIRCPLLNDDGKCSLYERRPFTCRAFLSSERSVCEAALRGYLADGTISDLSWLEVPQIIGWLFEGALIAATADVGLQTGRVDLVETIAHILVDPATIDHWAAGGTPFQTKPDPSEVISL